MSDDEEYKAKKAFPITDLLGGKVNLKPGEAPADAIEYLKYVAFEASQCKDVVVANVDERKLKKQTVVYANNRTEANSNSSAQPSREWKICQVSDFSTLRTHLAKMKLCNKKAITIDLPKKSDERSWCVLCLGSEIARTRFDTVGQEEIQANSPLAGIICSMDQPIVEKLLVYHIDWMESLGFSSHQGMWIYSLMAGLELPLTPDVCSLLRELARKCASTRDQLSDKSEGNVIALNLIICLVSKYFRQLDLEHLFTGKTFNKLY